MNRRRRLQSLKTVSTCQGRAITAILALIACALLLVPLPVLAHDAPDNPVGMEDFIVAPVEVDGLDEALAAMRLWSALYDHGLGKLSDSEFWRLAGPVSSEHVILEILDHVGAIEEGNDSPSTVSKYVPPAAAAIAAQVPPIVKRAGWIGRVVQSALIAIGLAEGTSRLETLEAKESQKVLPFCTAFASQHGAPRRELCMLIAPELSE